MRFVAFAAVTAGGIALVAWHGGIALKGGGGDLFAMCLARQQAALQAYGAGRFPLWNPFEFTGTPLLATAQGSVLYPPAIVPHLFWGPWGALQLIYALHAALLVYCVIRCLDAAGIAFGPAVASAALAASTLFFGRGLVAADHPNVMMGAVLLTPILLAWDAVVFGRRRALAWLALLVGLQWLAGYPELGMNTAILLGTFALVPGRRGGTRRLVLAAVAVALGFALAAVQTLPLAALAGTSLRASTIEAQAVGRTFFAHRDLTDLATTLLGRFGAATLFAALLGAATPGRTKRLWLAGALWSLFAAHWPFRLLYTVPPFDQVRLLCGWDTTAAIFVALLAGLGLEALRTAQHGRAATSVATAVVAAGALATGNAIGTAIAGACGIAALLIAHGYRAAWLAPAAFCIVHAAVLFTRLGIEGRFPPPDLHALASRVEVLHELRAERPDRVVDRDLVVSGLTLTRGIPQPVGYEPSLPPRRASEVLAITGLGRLLSPAHERAAWEYLGRHANVAAALGVGWVVVPAAHAPTLVRAGFVEKRALADGMVILHRPAAPRFQLLRDVVGAPNDAAALAALADPAFDPMREVVLTGTPPSDVRPTVGHDDVVELVRDDPEWLVLTVDAAAPAVLVVHDAYDPGWTATVDGVTRAIQPADHALRAVYVPAGRHRVEFRYRPRAFEIGAVLSVAAACVIAWLLVGRPGAVMLPGALFLAACGPTAPRHLVCLGDSNTASRWPEPDDVRWCEYIGAYPEFAGTRIDNFAAGGAQVHTWGDRGWWNGEGQLETALAAGRPDAIVLAFGTNDVRSGRSPRSIAHAYRALQRRAEARGAVVYVALAPPLVRDEVEANRRIDALNTILRQTFSPERLLDFNSGFTPADFGRDGIHLNERGQRKRAAIARAVLAGGRSQLDSGP